MVNIQIFLVDISLIVRIHQCLHETRFVDNPVRTKLLCHDTQHLVTIIFTFNFYLIYSVYIIVLYI